ncbi:Putative heat shock protein (plasmid) [Candidatus Erwinia haradaeae]|uniref:Heat shock protein n=1 Tax=Candidatus Erwinia haradaeae TaxID=1922217 RepID=A0A451DPU6_9GAMM|nr:Hsp20 family protein [Candidatus Erwinia haradaeae]VFP88803.1 Putative heat shock protein [Candidatus Erwinia haradaeae]
MAYRSFSLIPAWSNHLLSDRFTQMDNLFSRITGESPVTDAPVYNLVQKDKEHYEMTLSVPGYTQDELDISVLNNQLTLRGIPKPEKTGTTIDEQAVTWFHQGFKKKEFSLSFNLENRINIQQARLDHGLLKLQFTYDIPEQEKPKKIEISMDAATHQIIEHDKN